MKARELINALKKCDPEKEIMVSVDVSTESDDERTFDSRVYGIVMEVVNNDPSCVPVLVEMTDRNFREFPTGPRTKSREDI